MVYWTLDVNTGHYICIVIEKDDIMVLLSGQMLQNH